MPYSFNPFSGNLDYYASSSIGGPITGGTANSVIYIDGSGNLAQSNPAFTYDGTKLRVVSGADSTAYPAFVLTPPATGLRNDFDGSLGYFFAPTASLTVTHLGRWYAAGNTGNHPVGIYDNTTLVASGTVLAASASDAKGFKYVSISPVTLDPTKVYSIVTLEVNGGDQWKDGWDTTGYIDPQVNRLGIIYTSGTSLTAPPPGTAGTSIYSTPAFKFTSASNLSPVSVGYSSSLTGGLSVTSSGDLVIGTNIGDKTLGIGMRTAVGKGKPSTGLMLDVAGALGVSTSAAEMFRLTGSGTDVFRISQGGSTTYPGFRFNLGYLVMGATNAILLGYDNPTLSKVGVGGVVPVAQHHVLASSSSTVGSIVQGAASQSANLQEWRDSSNNPLALVSKDGDVEVKNSANGLILTSPNATRWRVQVSNAGALTVTSL